jgi:hypothetical protein
MTESTPPRLHPALRRNEAGEIAVHWPRLIALLAVVVAPMIIISLAIMYFTGKPIRAPRIIIPTILVLLPQLLLLHFAKRRAERRSLWQYSLSTLLASLTVACVLFALLGSDRRADLERFAKRQQFQGSLMQIVGKGSVHVTGGTLIQVQRPSFDDNDLRKVLQYREQLERSNFPISILDLSGTRVTDQGVAELKQVHSLKYCFFERTGVTDAAVDALDELPNLKVISFNGTQVTPERLLKLSQDRPDLKIEPQTYRKLKPQ